MQQTGQGVIVELVEELKQTMKIVDNKQKKVLFISHSFPPENISSTQRPMNFAKFLLDYNWKPFVATPEKHIVGPDCLLKNIRLKGVLYVYGVADL